MQIETSGQDETSICDETVVVLAVQTVGVVLFFSSMTQARSVAKCQDRVLLFFFVLEGNCDDKCALCLLCTTQISLDWLNLHMLKLGCHCLTWLCDSRRGIWWKVVLFIYFFSYFFSHSPTWVDIYQTVGPDGVKIYLFHFISSIIHKIFIFVICLISSLHI